MNVGYLPITPHLLFPQFLRDSDADEREIGMHMGLVLLSMCQELWVFGETISPGMAREIKRRGGMGKEYGFSMRSYRRRRNDKPL